MYRHEMILPAMVLASVLGLPLPEAEAQTARDLVCKKCVGPGELAKSAVTANQHARIVILSQSVTRWREHQET